MERIQVKENQKRDDQRIKYFLEQLSQKGFQIIQIENQKFHNLFLKENILFYCDLFTLNKFDDCFNQMNCYSCEGKLYQVIYDKNSNPIQKIEEGTFYIFMKRKNIFEINGQGVEYSGKSNFIKFKGCFKQGKPQEIQQDQKEIQPTAIPCSQRIIIRDSETGQQLISKMEINACAQNKLMQDQSIWLKFNQQFSIRDEQILDQRQWLNSSIIDAYVNYINLENEKIYFSMKTDLRSQLQQILIFPTSFTTNLGTSYTLEKAQKLFQQEILQFEGLNWDLKKIYNYIGFPINRKNVHWYFLLFNLQQNTVELFDSLPTFSFDENLVYTLEKILNLQGCNRIIKKDFSQQLDGYSCGYHVCSCIKYISSLYESPDLKYQYEEEQLRRVLLQVIKNEH